jgi:hypothetical protein
MELYLSITFSIFKTTKYNDCNHARHLKIH